MNPWLGRSLVLTAALGVIGCGRSTPTQYPELNGHRVQRASVQAHGAVPYQVAAYELVFPSDARPSSHAHRAGLLVDLTRGQGYARGFVEWAHPGEPPRMFIAEGRARQRNVAGEVVTSFDLALIYLAPGDAVRPAGSADLAPLSVTLLVHEQSGDATLIRRR